MDPHFVLAHMDRNLAMEAVRVTEAAALSASLMMGRGDEIAADRSAVEAMRKTLDLLALSGRVVIGEGDADEAPDLHVGQMVGTGVGPKVDLALAPLEGETIVAKGGGNALSVVAITEEGGFLPAPDVHMEKLAVGPGVPDGALDLDAPVDANLAALAGIRGRDVSELLVCILDRPRHLGLIRRVREAGARIMLISDGDISGVIAAAQPESGVDLYLGTGGAPEGVLSAAALRCLGGRLQGRLIARDASDRERIAAAGIKDADRKFETHELAAGDVMFAATGVTDGAWLRGVRRFAGGAFTHSVVMRSKSGTVRVFETRHNFTRGEAGDGV